MSNKPLTPKEQVLAEFAKLKNKMIALNIQDASLREIVFQTIDTCEAIVAVTPFNDKEILELEQAKLKKQLEDPELPF